MANLLSFPLRLSAGGYMATVEDDTDDAYIDQLVAMCLTRPEERPMVPGFGINDPTFDSIDAASIAIQVEMFGPPVSITDVQVVATSDTAQEVTVFFE
jgi:hypothetical protein